MLPLTRGFTLRKTFPLPDLPGPASLTSLCNKDSLIPFVSKLLKVSRRWFLQASAVLGSWTALHLLRRGAQVTLVDAWGPGNSRASSGGETRIIRGTYGPNQPYTKMVARATQLWKENEKRWRVKLIHQTGVLWMVTAGNDHFERGSLPVLRDAGIAYQELSVQDMASRWPQINLEGVHWGIYEPDGGFLTARISCQAVLDGFIAEGGEYKQAAVAPQGLDASKWDDLTLSDGS